MIEEEIQRRIKEQEQHEQHEKHKKSPKVHKKKDEAIDEAQLNTDSTPAANGAANGTHVNNGTTNGNHHENGDDENESVAEEDG